MEEKDPLSKIIFFLVLPIIFIGMTLFLFQRYAEIPQSSETILTLEQEIVQIAQHVDRVRSFLSQNSEYQTTLTLLTPEAAQQLAQKYPVIYGDLPQKDLYQARYTAGTRGYLVIVDQDTKQVLKFFRVGNITIGE